MSDGDKRNLGTRAPGPPGYFGLRNVIQFATNPLKLLRGMADTYGDTVHMKVLGRPWFLINHPDDIETAMVKNARIMGRDEYVVILQRVLGMGLLTNDGESWKKQRRLMATAFTPKRIRGYAEAMARVTDAGLEPWGDGGEHNLHEEMSRITMEVVADVLFGASVDERQVRIVRESMETINEFLSNSPEAVMKVPGWVPTPRNRAVNAAVKEIDKLLYDIIAQRRAEPTERDDLLGRLIAATDDDGSSMDDLQLRDEAVTLFLAGHETTALTMANTLYFLSKHPAIERRLYAEVEAVLGGRTPTAADVKAMPYAERVLKESMRLLPPAWTTGREATESLELGGVHIPKGAQLLMSQWVVHRDPRWFDNPEGFDPDRFLPERVKERPRFAYFPFGGGPRVCIGNHFAMMEATIILAMIVQRYRVTLLPGQRLSLSPSVTLRQKGPGLKVHIERRRPTVRDEAPMSDRAAE